MQRIIEVLLKQLPDGLCCASHWNIKRGEWVRQPDGLLCKQQNNFQAFVGNYLSEDAHFSVATIVSLCHFYNQGNILYEPDAVWHNMNIGKEICAARCKTGTTQHNSLDISIFDKPTHYTPLITLYNQIYSQISTLYTSLITVFDWNAKFRPKKAFIFNAHTLSLWLFRLIYPKLRDNVIQKTQEQKWLKGRVICLTPCSKLCMHK